MFENISSVFSLLFGPTSKVMAPTGPRQSPESKAVAGTSTWPVAWQIPSSSWPSLCHRDEERVTHEVNEYFLQEWKFPNQKARDTFVKGGFCRITCLYFPRAKEDRIHFACRLLTLLFLIDDLLEDMSFADGKAYNENLMPLMRGERLPSRADPAEYITYDLWESMRNHDKALAETIVEPVITFMRAQTDKARLGITELGAYLEYRERDVGKGVLAALLRFTMALHLTDTELQQMRPLDQNCAKHIAVVNDIYSWEREVQSAQTGHSEGAALCSAVKVMAEPAGVDFAASKRILWPMVREWELVHEELATQVAKHPAYNERLRDYISGLQYQMSGNELWSRTTLRYKVKS